MDGPPKSEIFQSGREAATKQFPGLEFHSNLGDVTLPPDVATARIDRDADFQISGNMLNAPSGPWDVRINAAALQRVLLEVHNGEIFKMRDGGLAVLARVSNIHLPFCLSRESAGWQPFFGHSSGQLIRTPKDMPPHEEIVRVQTLLNENLKMPFDVLSDVGKIGVASASGHHVSTTVAFDLGRRMKFQNVLFTEYGRDKDDGRQFVERITGYRPNAALEPRAQEQWVKDVYGQIRTSK